MTPLGHLVLGVFTVQPLGFLTFWLLSLTRPASARRWATVVPPAAYFLYAHAVLGNPLQPEPGLMLMLDAFALGAILAILLAGTFLTWLVAWALASLVYQPSVEADDPNTKR